MWDVDGEWLHYTPGEKLDIFSNANGSHLSDSKFPVGCGMECVL